MYRYVLLCGRLGTALDVFGSPSSSPSFFPFLFLSPSFPFLFPPFSFSFFYYGLHYYQKITPLGYSIMLVELLVDMTSNQNASSTNGADYDWLMGISTKSTSNQILHLLMVLILIGGISSLQCQPRHDTTS
jgi:hypothetical protein